MAGKKVGRGRRDIKVEKGQSYKLLGIFLMAQRVLLSEQGQVKMFVTAHLTGAWQKQCR